MKIKLKLILSILAIIAVGLTYYITTKVSQKDTEGSITIIVINENKEEVVNRNVNYNREKLLTFEDILKSNFDVTIKSGMLLEIEGVHADTKEYFLKLYLNGVSANYGIRQLPFQDQDVIKIVYTKVGDFSNES